MSHPSQRPTLTRASEWSNVFAIPVSLAALVITTAQAKVPVEWLEGIWVCVLLILAVGPGLSGIERFRRWRADRRRAKDYARVVATARADFDKLIELIVEYFEPNMGPLAMLVRSLQSMKDEDTAIYLLAKQILETCRVIYLIPVPAETDQRFMATMRVFNELVGPIFHERLQLFEDLFHDAVPPFAEKPVKNLRIHANRFIEAYGPAWRHVARYFDGGNLDPLWQTCPLAPITVVEITEPKPPGNPHRSL